MSGPIMDGGYPMAAYPGGYEEVTERPGEMTGESVAWSAFHA